MTKPVRTVNMFASVHSICKILLGCTHCGFPVVKSLGEKLENTFCGEITRLELRNLVSGFPFPTRLNGTNVRRNLYQGCWYLVPRQALHYLGHF